MATGVQVPHYSRERRWDESPARAPLGAGSSIDELLDRAVAAINRGDRVAANALAGQVLAVDHGNADAEDLLAAPSNGGEIRRLTIMYVDLVDSAALSSRAEPDTYGVLVTRYRDLVMDIVNRFDGHVGSPKGEGLLALFGHPGAHEDDVRRAVLAGLEITREVAGLVRRSGAASGWRSPRGRGYIVDWSISTPPKTMSTASAPTWPREYRGWPRPGPW